MNEFDFIHNKLKKLAAPKEISFNFQDDTCVLPAINYVFTTDTIVENTHFFNDDPADSIAHKLLHVNLSDLAAKSAYPKYYSLNLTFKNNLKEDWYEDFIDKLAKTQKKYNFSLIGGDVTKGENLVLSASFFGETKTNNLPLNQCAKIDDDIFVSGKIGNSYAGLKDKKSNFRKFYLYPQARLDLCEIITKYANAATDISDGLVADLEKLLNSSSLGAVISLPNNLFNDEVSNKYKLENLIKAGDDYQIIMTSSEKNRAIIEENSDFKFIGKITQESELIIKTTSGNKISNLKSGYQHKF